MSKLYQVCQAVGYFRSENASDKSLEADVALSESVDIEMAWHFEGQGTIVCDHCSRRIRKRVFPAVVYRIAGELKDFANSTWDSCIASESVCYELASRFNRIESCPVVIWNLQSRDHSVGQLDLSNRWPDLNSSIAKKYIGSAPRELQFPVKIKIEKTQSTFVRENECAQCCEFRAKLTGIEQMPHEEKTEEGDWKMMPHRPRRAGEGLIVQECMLEGADAFETDSGLKIVRENVKSHIEERRWKNIRFIEVGETVD